MLVAAAIAGGLVLTGGDDGEPTATTEDVGRTTTSGGEPSTTPSVATTSPSSSSTSRPDPLAGVEFVALTDDTGRLIIEVPAEWAQAATAANAAGQPTVEASTDLAAFQQGFTASGVRLSAVGPVPPVDPDAAIDFVADGLGLDAQCQPGGKQDYADSAFAGRAELFGQCGAIGTTFLVLVASRADGQTVSLLAQVVAGQPVEIFDHLLATFNLVD